MSESIYKNNELENEVSLDMSYFWYPDIDDNIRIRDDERLTVSNLWCIRKLSSNIEQILGIACFKGDQCIPYMLNIFQPLDCYYRILPGLAFLKYFQYKNKSTKNKHSSLSIKI